MNTSNVDKFYAYVRGWSCGAAYRQLDPKLSEHRNEEIKTAYLDGWGVGRKAARDMAKDAENLYGYSPSIIRTQDLNEPTAGAL